MLAIVVSTALTLLSAAAQTRKPAVGSAPPQPVPLTVKTARGATAEIPLRIFGRRNQTLTFLIRTRPGAGKVTVPENAGAETATVRYTPPADRAVTRETFTYAVRSADGVSAPVEITVEILDTPADLVGPGELRFGIVLIGATEMQAIELRNRGGDIAEGTVQVDAPWRIDAGERYRLEPKARAFVRVTFAPTAAGTFSGELRYSSQPDRATSLIGEAQAPIELRPEKLTLGFEPITGVRSGIFEVVNHTGTAQSILLQAGERVQVERTLSLPAGARAVVHVATRAEDVAALEECIRLEAGKLSIVLPVRSAAAPAAVEVSARSLLLRPESATGKPRADLVLENRGGTVAEIEVQASPPFAVNVSAIVLAPGEKQPLTVVLPTKTNPQARGALRISGGGITRTVELRVEQGGALLVAQGAPAGSSSIRQEPLRERDAPAREPASLLAEVMARGRTRVVGITPRSVTLEWSGAIEAARLRGEMRNLALRDHELEITWRGHTGFKAEALAENMRGTFSGLEPGRPYTLRVVRAQPADAPEELVAAASLTTPPLPAKGSLFNWRRVLLLAALALVGYVTVQRWRARPAGF